MLNPKYAAFVKAVSLGSFKKAAEELGYTQAGISYMINALEQQVGFTLFTRDRAGIELTPDGKSLLPWIQNVYNAEVLLNTHIHEMHDIETGSLRIACFASTAIHWMPELLDVFLAEHPHIDVTFSVYENQEPMEEDTWRGDFDCCFVVLPSHKNFFTIPLVQDPMYAVVAPDHPLADAPCFTKEALAREPYIKIRNDSFTEMDAVFKRHGVTPNTKFVVDNDYAVMGMVSKGLGFSLFSDIMLRNSPFDVKALKLEIPTHREVALAVRSYSKSSFATKAFIECVRKWVANNEPTQLPRQ